MHLPFPLGSSGLFSTTALFCARLRADARVDAIVRTLLPVALSLAIFGCELQGRKPLTIEDRTPIVGANRATTQALGVETLGGVFTPLIKAGTRVPCSVSEVFSTATDGQSQITVTVVRGSEPLAASNHPLGRFRVGNISDCAPRRTDG